KLEEYFGSQEEAYNAILKGQGAAIASISNIGIKTAINLLLQDLQHREGVNLNTVLKTKDVTAMYNKVMALIQKYLSTEYGKEKLSTYFPLPSSKIELIKTRQAIFQEAKQAVSTLSTDQILQMRALLKDIKLMKPTLTNIKIKGRIILTTNPETTQKLKSRQIQKLVQVDQLKLGEKATDYIRGFDLVVFIPGPEPYDTALDYAENVIILKSELDITSVVPELILSQFAVNLDTVKSACELIELLNQLPPGPMISELQDSIDYPVLKKVGEILGGLTEKGEVAAGRSKTYDRFHTAIKNFEMILAEVESRANDRIKENVTTSAVKIAGDQIISILQAARGGNISPDRLKGYLPPEIADIVLSSLDQAEDDFCQALKLEKNEIQWVEGIIKRTVALPIEINRKKANEVESILRKKLRVEEFRLKLEMAKELAEAQTAVSRGIQTLLEADVPLGVGLFSKEYDLTVPQIETESIGVGFEGGVNLFLKEREVQGNVTEPVMAVDYVVGEVSFKPPGTNGERIVLLSGANSGGKTCLIQTCMHILLLGQSGFLVPAQQAYISLFDEFNFYAKAEGILSAGAFETSLARLAELIVSPARKFAAFDEWEAATEAEAASRVVAASLDMFNENQQSCVVFVSHLAKQISSRTSANIRIDGIEAAGLNEDLTLKVNRSPKFDNLARSMPELIVTRLLKTSTEKQRQIYERILNELKS
ncbi:MAG: hypothetical protein ACW976_06820, partial [Candidatus Ranarchaeia archaeon]